jgi:hypothetical protein
MGLVEDCVHTDPGGLSALDVRYRCVESLGDVVE